MNKRPDRTSSLALQLLQACLVWCSQAATLTFAADARASGPPALPALPALPASAADDEVSNGPARAWLVVARHLRTTCRQDDDCRSLAIGFRACGGPEGFVAWSASSTDADALRIAARHYERARRTQAAALGEASTCDILSDPGAFCARPAAAGAGAASGQCTLHQRQGALR